MKSRVIAVIMGGGRGSRLHPLTKERCKPAVPLAGMYRLVDIPISNCINSGINQIYLLTQFNTASLHRHIRDSYAFDHFGKGFVETLAAEQNEQNEAWYQGTADAVRQNLIHLDVRDDDIVLILSGDQLYRMDYRKIIEQHRETGARVTVAATPLDREEASAFGLMRVGADLQIEEFAEKPKDPKVIDKFQLGPEITKTLANPEGEYVLASMGIYAFTGEALKFALNSDYTDFGHQVIPGFLETGALYSHVFEGYWEDIGTVRAFFDANLRLTDPIPPFNFFDGANPIYTHARYLPAAKVNECAIDHCVLANGCILSAAELTRCVIGVRSHVRKGTTLKNVIMMGSAHLATDEDRAEDIALGRPHIGVGEDCVIEDAIIDANARIGNNVKLSPKGKPNMYTEGPVVVRDGVLIVCKNGIVPDNTVI